MSDPLALSLASVSFAYPGNQVLSRVSQRWAPGVNVVLGLNGAGKTTLLRILATTLQPDAGRMEYHDGAESVTAPKMFREILGYQPQTAQWRPRMSVRDFVHYFAWCRRVPSSERADRVHGALEAVDLTDQAGVRVSALSGGQYRRLLLAQALVHDPGILILDEPSAGLDPQQRVRLRETVERLADGRVVIYSTHVLEDVVGIAGRVSILHGGAFAFDGTPDELADLGVSPGARSSRMEEGFMRVVAGTAPR